MHYRPLPSDIWGGGRVPPVPRGIYATVVAATGNERRPKVVDDIPEPAAGVRRMSADDDDQADQQHKLADPGMEETDHSVLETTRPQLCSRPVVVHAASGGLQGCP